MGKGTELRKLAKKEQRKVAAAAEKKKKEPEPPPTPSDDDDNDSGQVEESPVPVFTFNNRPVFATTLMSNADRRNPFKIEMGEAVFDVSETSMGAKKVLLVSQFDGNLDDYVENREDRDIFKFRGKLRSATDETRELMKGIMAAFSDLIKETLDDDPTYLHNLSNYLISGLNPYIAQSDSCQYQYQNSDATTVLEDAKRSPPIKVIIVKANKNGVAQRDLQAKATEVSKVLKLLYSERYYAGDRSEWNDLYNHFSVSDDDDVGVGNDDVGVGNDDEVSDRYSNIPDARLRKRLRKLRNSLEDLDSHHVFWRWERRGQFMEYCSTLLHEKISRDVCISIFDTMQSVEAPWENEFMKIEPLWSCYETRLQPVLPTGPSSVSMGAGPSLIPSHLVNRRKRGFVLVTKIRNCFAHLTDYTMIPNPNSAKQLIPKYLHIQENAGFDDFKNRHYVSLKILQTFPSLWNELLPRVRAKGFNEF